MASPSSFSSLSSLSSLSSRSSLSSLSSLSSPAGVAVRPWAASLGQLTARRREPPRNAAVDHLAADPHDQPAEERVVELDLQRDRAPVEPAQGVTEAVFLLRGEP